MNNEWGSCRRKEPWYNLGAVLLSPREKDSNTSGSVPYVPTGIRIGCLRAASEKPYSQIQLFRLFCNDANGLLVSRYQTARCHNPEYQIILFVTHNHSYNLLHRVVQIPFANSPGRLNFVVQLCLTCVCESSLWNLPCISLLAPRIFLKSSLEFSPICVPLCISYSVWTVSLNNVRTYNGCYSSCPSVNPRKPAAISSSAKVKPFVFLTDTDPDALNTTFVTTLSFWEELRHGPINSRQRHAHLSAETCLALWLLLSTCLFRQVLKFLIK